ncbi:MAG: hypothetical protein IIZ48_00175 [Erysipelotrichales bacterium]|nr:hypothetical protein [Erysipelotrichales bacterium]
MKKRAGKTIGILSILHMLVDFVCAFSLYGILLHEGGQMFLVYNFCAFALQMPLGVVLDAWNLRKGNMLPGIVFTALGVIMTLTGTFTSVMILGTGNALFHVGGGVLTIHEDDHAGFAGRGLGVFVAPGAIGLCAGTLISSMAHKETVIAVCALIAANGVLALIHCLKNAQANASPKSIKPAKEYLPVLIGCFLVVVLRSFTGMAMSFPWKTGAAVTLISVLFVAFGKAAGGFVFSKYSRKTAGTVTLLGAAVLFALGKNMIPGMLGLFFFNMTMPVTLYMLKEKMPDTPGLAFGILTFGLFIGYLPVYYGVLSVHDPLWIGTAGSLLSLGIFLWVWNREGKRT